MNECPPGYSAIVAGRVNQRARAGDEVPSMTTPTREEMHADHRAWEAENATWRDDVRAWQEELAGAREELARLGEALAREESELARHAASIRIYEQGVAHHERAMVQAARAGNGGEEAVGGHMAEARRQAELRLAHERIKKHHHARMALWRMLLKAIEEPL